MLFDPNGKRVAIIDMGTNTFHLSIAQVEPNLEILLDERKAVKLGLGGINDGLITEEAIERALQTLENFKLRIDSFGVERTLAFGTSALRSARNGKNVIEKIKAKTNIDCTIISGDEEATYIYYGVRAAVPLGLAKTLIIDIGGGSVEFIIANQTEIFWKQSLEIGAQRLIEQFQKHDPILASEKKAIEAFLETKLQPMFSLLREHRVASMVGSSGSFETLLDISHATAPSQYKSINLSHVDFNAIFELLLQKNRGQRLAIPGMIDLRVDMIVVGCIIINFILQNHSFSSIRVSLFSLKEGVLASLNKAD